MDPKFQAFLDLIARSEGTSTSKLTVNKGYDVIVDGDVEAGEIGLEVFKDYSNHPFALGRPAKIIQTVPVITRSTASGRYQLELKWWRAYQAMLHLLDFSPTSQDAVALRQIQERGADSSIQNGNIAAAISACSNIWASFPNNNYGQPKYPLSQLVSWYDELLNPPSTLVEA